MCSRILYHTKPLFLWVVPCCPDFQISFPMYGHFSGLWHLSRYNGTSTEKGRIFMSEPWKLIFSKRPTQIVEKIPKSPEPLQKQQRLNCKKEVMLPKSNYLQYQWEKRKRGRGWAFLNEGLNLKCPFFCCLVQLMKFSLSIICWNGLCAVSSTFIHKKVSVYSVKTNKNNLLQIVASCGQQKHTFSTHQEFFLAKNFHF